MNTITIEDFTLTTGHPGLEGKAIMALRGIVYGPRDTIIPEAGDPLGWLQEKADQHCLGAALRNDLMSHELVRMFVHPDGGSGLMGD